MGKQIRIGVFVCHCGINISHTVDVKAVRDFAATLPNVVVAEDYLYMCSDPGQNLIAEKIQEKDLNRVVVSSCTPRMHEPTFRNAISSQGLNPYFFEMANIREQCSWVHSDRGEATEKAKALVASAVAKAALLEPLQEREVEVLTVGMVVGGGVAGIMAALDIASAGFPVYLVEKEDHLGGRVADLFRTYPLMEPPEDLLREPIAALLNHPNATVLLNSQLVELSGYVGNFDAVVESVEDGGRNRQEIKVGSITVATGYDPFDARLKPELGYGQYPEVVTTLEFEKMLAENEGEVLVNGTKPKDIVFVKCVGSRDKTVGNPYCSRVCCMVAARQADYVQRALPDANVTVLYMDVRTFGKGHEEYYDQVRSSGVMYRRGNPAEVGRQDGRLVVRVEDTFVGQFFDIEADLVVLAVGMVPRPETKELAHLLKLSESGDGFLMELHPKLAPVNTASDGIFLAGCAQAPKDITDTIAQAKGAASSSIVPFIKGTVKVESATSTVDEELCAGCGMCEAVCPYGALKLNPRKGKMTVNVVLCKGCGSCAVTCPSNAITLLHFTPRQVMAQVDALMTI